MAKARCVIYRDGIRYWATKHRFGRRWKIKFWSSHPWPFYHGYYLCDQVDKNEALRRLKAWMPAT